MAATKQEQSTASSTPAAAAPTTKALKEGEVFKAGSWHVAQKLDAMTDKKSCTALYQGAWTIQGTTDTLYVSLSGRGGVKAYWLRIDDEPADELRLASDIERKISAADLGHSFNRIINSKRVRLQVSTILSTLLVEDINMAGFKEAVDYMKANCQA
jgi:hypothetical protein